MLTLITKYLSIAKLIKNSSIIKLLKKEVFIIKNLNKRDKRIFFFTIFSGLFFSILLAVQALIQNVSPNNKWFLCFQVFLGILLCFLPFLVERIFKFIASSTLKIFYWVFIYLAVFLGTGLSFYSIFFYWDKILHFSSAILLTLVGIGILSVTEPNFKKLSIKTIILFGFLFAMTCGIFWEFYEFTFDGILGLNMQRFATSSGKKLVGRLALMDTMGDLITNTIGTLIFSILCYIKLKKKPHFLKKLSFSINKK